MEILPAIGYSHSSPYLVHKSTANAEFAQFGSHSGPSSNKRVLSFMNNLWIPGYTKHTYTSSSGNHSHTLNLNGDTETDFKNMTSLSSNIKKEFLILENKNKGEKAMNKKMLSLYFFY